MNLVYLIKNYIFFSKCQALWQILYTFHQNSMKKLLLLFSLCKWEKWSTSMLCNEPLWVMELEFSPKLSDSWTCTPNHGPMWFSRKQNIQPIGPFLIQSSGPHANHHKPASWHIKSMGTRSVNIQAPCPVASLICVTSPPTPTPQWPHTEA
jgi:hypothetical protein